MCTLTCRDSRTFTGLTGIPWLDTGCSQSCSNNCLGWYGLGTRTTAQLKQTRLKLTSTLELLLTCSLFNPLPIHSFPYLSFSRLWRPEAKKKNIAVLFYKKPFSSPPKSPVLQSIQPARQNTKQNHVSMPLILDEVDCCVSFYIQPCLVYPYFYVIV